MPEKEMTVPQELSVAELDERLERSVEENERSERLICEDLFEMRKRRGHEQFGFASIFDYAAERFGFSARKTRYLRKRFRSVPPLEWCTRWQSSSPSAGAWG